jgi:excisionase family DNA binding protein
MQKAVKRSETQLGALSTGQAARYCYVTSETILNWIRSGGLHAQRTAGGQFRIRLQDLRAFMAEAGMSTALLDEEKDIRPYCWEFHCEISARYGRPSREVCEGCLVHRSGTLNCWELHALLPLTARKNDRCSECEYFLRYQSSEDDGRDQERAEGSAPRKEIGS